MKTGFEVLDIRIYTHFPFASDIHPYARIVLQLRSFRLASCSLRLGSGSGANGYAETGALPCNLLQGLKLPYAMQPICVGGVMQLI